MPGSKSGDRSPSTENVGGLYIGSVLSENGLPTSPPVPEGFGRMQWDNDVTYEGEWRSGLHHGEGSKIHRNGGGYSGSWNMGQRCGRGSALYGGKWGYDRWEGNFVNDLEEGEGTLFLLDGTEKNLQYEAGDLVGDVPCNEEYEKSVFFRRLNEDTTDDTIITLLSEFGPLDYCYIARDAQGVSNKIGRAKFRPVSNPANDKHLNKTERILSARQRAIDNARAAVEGLDKANIDSSEIRVHLARKADMKEFVRYGDY
ncbi:hypothetical protein TrST_g13489 [Triparma strigata]|uniref:Uncharacterized protein n=2 Tax=Triparma strigata TaxID=1606541 RepID=A0A9W7BA49_9STRA|nr:hypothetical protein TrST_g13489 [Triparma strigata]